MEVESKSTRARRMETSKQKLSLNSSALRINKALGNEKRAAEGEILLNMVELFELLWKHLLSPYAFPPEAFFCTQKMLRVTGIFLVNERGQ